MISKALSTAMHVPSCTHAAACAPLPLPPPLLPAARCLLVLELSPLFAVQWQLTGFAYEPTALQQPAR